MLAVLPKVWFTELHQLVLLLITAAGIVAVMKGADWLVEGAAGLAYKLGMAKVVIGATIVSLGTTSPEAAVSVLAAWEGNPGLALGNGVGSIIADTGLIFGVGCLLTALPADKFVLTRQGWVQFGSAVLLAALCYYDFIVYGDDAALGRWVGIGFLILLAGYLAVSVRWSRAHPRAQPGEQALEPDIDQVLPETDPRREGESGAGPLADESAGEARSAEVGETESAIRSDLAVWQLLGLMVVGLAVVVLGGDALVKSAGQLAMRWGVPDAVVASTLIAFGTSLPELVVGVTSIRKGHPELLVGNVVGADILNVLFVVGAAAVAAPLNVVPVTPLGPDYSILSLLLPTMLAMLLLFRGYIFAAIRTGYFARWMGLPLVVMYVAYVILQYVLSAGQPVTAHGGM
jgi:cation:H+ antiporter